MNTTCKPFPWSVIPRTQNDFPIVLMGTCSIEIESDMDEVAYLIAAAPDLLEALQDVVSAADGKGWEQLDPSFQKQRDAIAKALGVKV